MRRIVKGELVKMTEVEILADLDDEIKNFAGIDVQILHRFNFLPMIDDEDRPYIGIFDRYKEEPLPNKNFGDLAVALDYLRDRYKKEPGTEYEVIERKAGTKIKPKPTERKEMVKITARKAIEDLSEILDMSSIREKDRDKFIKEFYKDLWDLERDKGDEE